jgi:protein-tyrosine phosphatase
MAETVLRAELAAAGLGAAVELDSAGTGDWQIGSPMYTRARKALARRGYHAAAHRARQFQASWLAERDLVLAMDESNLADLRRLAASDEAAERVSLFGEAAGLSGADGGAEVPDPYGGGAAEFGFVLDLLEHAAPIIAGRLALLLEPTAGTLGETVGPGRPGSPA